MKSLQIIEDAKIELPATAKIGFALPDDFAKAATGTWGTLQNFLDPPDNIWKAAGEAVKANPFVLPTKKKDDLIEIITEDAAAEESAAGSRLDTGINQGGWGVSAEDADNPGWGVNTEDDVDNPGWGAAPGAAEWGDGWGSSGEEGGTGKWVQAEEEVLRDWSLTGPPASFLTCFGLVPIERSFVHNYRPAIVEENLRAIERIYQPGEYRAEGEEATWETENLCVVEFKPWRKPEDSHLREPSICELVYDDIDGSEEQKPVRKEVTMDIYTRSKILILVPPSVAKLFVKGMVIGGIFVKMIQHPVECDAKPREWWYIEKNVQTLPSYYKELNDNFIVNLVY